MPASGSMWLAWPKSIGPYVPVRTAQSKAPITERREDWACLRSCDWLSKPTERIQVSSSFFCVTVPYLGIIRLHCLICITEMMAWSLCSELHPLSHFTHLCTRSFHRYLLHTYHVPGSVLALSLRSSTELDPDFLLSDLFQDTSSLDPTFSICGTGIHLRGPSEPHEVLWKCNEMMQVRCSVQCRHMWDENCFCYLKIIILASVWKIMIPLQFSFTAYGLCLPSAETKPPWVE